MNRLCVVLACAAFAGFVGCNHINNPPETQGTKFTLSLTSSHGSVALSPSGGVYDSGATVTMTATPSAGYAFGGWSGDLTGTANPATIIMNSDKNVTAAFNQTAGGIHGTISSDTAWNLSSNDYHIDGDLTINGNVTWGKKIKVRIDDDASVTVNGNGTLTIEEGVEVKLGTGSYVAIGYSTSGTLVTHGTDSLPITFTKNTGVQNWGYTSGGILLYDKTTAQTVIDHCIIEYATTGIYVDGIAAVITNCTIRNNAELGIHFVGTAAPKDSASFINDSITGNGGDPIRIAPEGLTSLSGDTYLNGNTSEGILVSGGSAVTKSGTWKKHGVPYIFDDYASIGSSGGTKITVAPGVVCKFNTDTYLQVAYSYDGTLVAQGTDSLPITFTKNTGVQNWGSATAGIILWDKTTAQTVFDHCIIEYATSGISIMSLPAVITNCTIRNNAKYGIDFNNKAMPKDSASFVNDSITGNGSYPVSIVAEGLAKLSGDTYMDGNTPDAIEVTGGNVTQTGVWRKHGVPYFFADYANIGAAAGVTVTINPGVLCRFDADAYLNVGYSYPATIIANGTAADTIKLTCAVSGSPWGSNSNNGSGIMFWSKTTTNTSLSYCLIDSARNGIYVDATQISASNCKIRNCTGTGIIFSANGSPKDSTSFLHNECSYNGDFGIKIYASNLGKLSGTESCYANANGGFFVTGDKVDANATWKKQGLPYIISGEVRIESATGSTVTIALGTRLEFLSESFISVGYSQNGALIADGTPAFDDPDPERAVISFSPHTTGTDWGSASTNGAGIELWGGTAGTTTLKNCYIAHATAGVYVDTKNTVTIKGCNIGANKTYGIGYASSAVPITGITGNYAGDGPNPSGDLINLHP
jgi:hypothetical protein